MSNNEDRSSILTRNTRETQITLELMLDGTGKFEGSVDCGFLRHMLELFTMHGRFDMNIKAFGDTHVDYHHLVEDTGIVLGKSFKNALSDMRGIKRYGSFIMPMDEALVLTATDISGRQHLEYNAEVFSARVGDFDTELIKEFWLGFTRGLNCTMHIKKLSGENTHHILEAVFKSAARTLSQAVQIDERFGNDIPSTKGTIDI